MKKNSGRKERRRLARSNRIEENKKIAAKKHFAMIKARNRGQEITLNEPIQKKPIKKQSSKWWCKRKKAWLYRSWVKQKIGR